MSIAGIGSQSSGNVAQMLSSLLSRLDTTSKTSDTTDTTTTSQSTSTSVSSDSNLTGTTKPSLSSMILGALIGLQGQSDSQSSSSSTSSASTDPVQNLFSAMDSDTDGSVTQSELETYLEQVGGTSEQADSLYSLLNTDSEEGISEEEMASQAAPPPPPPGGGPGGPPPSDTADSSSTDDVSDQLVSLFDSNGDGTVSQSELTEFVTAHGGTESDAATEFASLDTSNSGSLTASNFSDAIDKLQNSYKNDPYASVNSLLDMFSDNTAAGSSVSVSA
jgi:Ca2+-binding EF-hand superfamily protein